MDAGKLNERIDVLSLEKRDGAYVWVNAGSVWASAETIDKTNLFSRVGLGEKTIEIIMRRRALSLHQAILWNEKHCFLTGIKEIDRRYLKVTAALVNVSQCKLLQIQYGKDQYNRPVAANPKPVFHFPAVLTEKYLGFVQGEPMTRTDVRYVIITPKPVVLKEADLVEVNGARYAVQVCHTLDEYKNEYEISLKKDV